MKLSAKGTWCIQGATYLEVVSYGYDEDGDLNNMVCIGWSGEQDPYSWRALTPVPILIDNSADIRRVFSRYDCVLASQDDERPTDRT